MKNQKQANINIKVKDLFFRWLEITSPFHDLRPTEQKVLALLLYHHYRLKKDITNEKILWKMVFDYETKLSIREELNIKDPSFQNNLTTLRKKNIIVDNRITPAFIPDIDKNSENFKIIFNFNIIHE